MKQIKRFVILVMLGAFSSLSVANQLFEYSIEEALNTDEARLRLGDSVKFYFAEKPAELSGQVIAVSKVLRKTTREKANPCHWAFLSSLLKLKEEALNRNSHYVVNVVSNYKNNVIASKKTYQCSVGAVVAAVALKGEIMSPAAAITSNSAPAPSIHPVDTSNAILMPEPVVTPGGTYPQTPQPQSPDKNAVEERLRVLKGLYDAGEIDQATYEMQKQRILNSI